jgi:hypothetical protein
MKAWTSSSNRSAADEVCCLLMCTAFFLSERSPAWVDHAGFPHLIGVDLRRTTALTSPYGQMPFLIPAVVPLVPANQAKSVEPS